ncbi:MAG: glycoside hydrolase family protein [Hyphomicrobiaceae bacterium]
MIHDDAIDLIQYFEGCFNEAYACPAHTSQGGKWPYLTIGYGHSGPDVRPGMRVTTAQAREMLARDLSSVEDYVSRKVRIALSPVQMGAVCALAFNVKPGLFDKSQALVQLNAGNFGAFSIKGAMRHDLAGLTGMSLEWAEFRNRTLANGKLEVLNGLVKRRCCELQLFHFGSWAPPDEDRMPQMVAALPQREPEVWRPGMRNEQVVDLHMALEVAGFPTTCNDAYTWVTAEAIKAFQTSHGIEPTGIYDAQTAQVLSAAIQSRTAAS